MSRLLFRRLILGLGILGFHAKAYSSSAIEMLAHDLEVLDPSNGADSAGISETLNWGFELHRFVDPVFATQAVRIRNEIYGLEGRGGLYNQTLEVVNRGNGLSYRLHQRLEKIRAQILEVQALYHVTMAKKASGALALHGTYFIYQENVLRPVFELSYLVSGIDAFQAYGLQKSLNPKQYISEALRFPAQSANPAQDFRPDVGILSQLKQYQDEIHAANSDLEKFEVDLRELEKNPSFISRTWYGRAWRRVWDTVTLRFNHFYWDEGKSDEEVKALIARRDELIKKLESYDEKNLEILREWERQRQSASFLANKNQVHTAISPYGHGIMTIPQFGPVIPPLTAKTREEQYKEAQDRRKRNYIEGVRLLTISNMLNQMDALKKVARDTSPIRLKDRAPGCYARYSNVLQPEINIRMVPESDRKGALNAMISASGLVVGTPEFREFFMQNVNPDPVMGSFSGTLPFFQLRIAQQGKAVAEGKELLPDPRDPYNYSQITHHFLGEPGFDDLATFSFVYNHLISKAISDRFVDPNNEYNQKHALAIFQAEEHVWEDTAEPLDPDEANADDDEVSGERHSYTATPFLNARMKTQETHDWEKVVPDALKKRMEQTRILVTFPPFYGPEANKQWALRLLFKTFDRVPEEKLKWSGLMSFFSMACGNLSSIKVRKYYVDVCNDGPRNLDFSERVKAWRQRLQKYSGEDEVVAPAYAYDDDLRAIWGDLRELFYIWAHQGFFQEFTEEGQPWTNEWEFVKAQMGVNPWAGMRLSFLIAMDEGNVSFDETDSQVIPRFMKELGKKTAEELTPEEMKKLGELKIPLIRRNYSFSANANFRSSLWKAASTFGLDRPLTPMLANRTLGNKDKKLIWEDIIHADNKRSFWALMSKNKSYGDYINLIDTVEKTGLLTKNQVNHLRGQMANSGIDVSDIDRWLARAEQRFPKFLAEDYKATTPAEIQERWKKILALAPDQEPRASDLDGDGTPDMDLPDAIKFEMYLDIWRARGNPELQQGLLRLLKSRYRNVEDDDIKSDLKASFFDRDKSFKMPFFEQAYVAASKVRVEDLTDRMEELCNFDASTLDGFKNIFYLSTRFHEQMEKDLGLQGTPPEVYAELSRMSDRDKADLWNGAKLMLIIIGFEASKALCLSPAAPVGCPLAAVMAAGMAAGAGMIYYELKIINNRRAEWNEREDRMKSAKRFREIEFNRDSDVAEFKGGGAGGFVTELFFASTLAVPLITSVRLVYKSGAAGLKVAVARMAGKGLKPGQLRSVLEEIEVDAARSILKLGKAKLVSDIIARVKAAEMAGGLGSKIKNGISALWKSAGEASEVIESVKEVDLGVAKEIYKNFSGRGEDLSRFVRMEFRTDPKRVYLELREYYARPNPARLKRLAELDPKLFREISSGNVVFAGADEAHARFLTQLENLLRSLEQARGDQLVKVMAENMDTLAPFLSKFSFRYSSIMQKGAKFGRGMLFAVTMSGSPWMFSNWPGLRQLARRAFLKRLIAARSKLRYHIEIKPHLIAMGYDGTVMKVDLLDLFSKIRAAADNQLEETMKQSEKLGAGEAKKALATSVQRAVDDFEINFSTRILANRKGVPIGELKLDEITETRNLLFAANNPEQRLKARAYLRGLKMDDIFHPQLAQMSSNDLVNLLNKNFADLFENLDQTVLQPLIAASSRKDVRRIDELGQLLKLIEKRVEIITVKNKTEAVIVY